MKRVLSLALSLAVSASLVGCTADAINALTGALKDGGSASDDKDKDKDDEDDKDSKDSDDKDDKDSKDSDSKDDKDDKDSDSKDDKDDKDSDSKDDKDSDDKDEDKDDDKDTDTDSSDSSANPLDPRNFDFSKFEAMDTFPNPEGSRVFERFEKADIDLAKDAFKKRYAKAKKSAFKVLQMYIDSLHFIHANRSLGLALMSVVTKEGTSLIDSAINEAGKTTGAGCVGACVYRTYYKGVRSSDDFKIPDFAKRQLVVAKEGGKITSPEEDDPESLTPEGAIAGDTIRIGVINALGKSNRSVKLEAVNDNGDWKVVPDGTITIGL